MVDGAAGAAGAAACVGGMTLKLIDADIEVTTDIYDGVEDKRYELRLPIAEYLNRFTSEGCPEAAQQWISVKDRLPESQVQVLAVKQLKSGLRHVCLAYCIPIRSPRRRGQSRIGYAKGTITSSGGCRCRSCRWRWRDECAGLDLVHHLGRCGCRGMLLYSGSHPDRRGDRVRLCQGDQGVEA